LGAAAGHQSGSVQDVKGVFEMQLLDIGHHHLLTHLIKQPEPPMHITDESSSNSLDHANAITAYFAP
jgi:hypothetical protein